MKKDSLIESAYWVPGLPHTLLAHEKSSKWKSLHDSYEKVRKRLEEEKPDVLLIYSTSWFSVMGHLIQGDPNPKHYLVDHNWHEFGTMHYDFPVDVSLAKACQKNIAEKGYTAKLVNYEGFPVDTGTVVAEKLLNPENKFSSTIVSCNIYADKKECLDLGNACREALVKENKKASALVISSLSSRFFTEEIDPEEDHISSAKDDEWNQKVLSLFRKGSLQELSRMAPDFGREGHADMGFKGIWWLEGLLGEEKLCRGEVFDYQPVWGTGAALCALYPTKEGSN